MIRFLYFLFLQTICFASIAQNVNVTNPRCEYRVNPLGVDAETPMLSWELQSTHTNVMQSAYRILVADDVALLNKNEGNIWDSRQVKSNASIQISYKGKKLQAAKKYYWKVMVWDEKNRPSSFSTPAFWQMGILKESDWNGAKWIGYDVLPDSLKIVPFAHQRGKKEWGDRNNVLPLLRKSLKIQKPVKAATAFICGLGHFELSINGQKIGDHFLDPGWTQYDKQTLYVTFDVTKTILQNENVVGVELGNGFYYIPGGPRYRKLTGAYGYPKMIAKILIEYADGSAEDIVSDESWKATPAATYFSSIYGGEDYDANNEQSGWNDRNFNDAAWRNAVVTSGPPQLNSQMAEPLKVFDRFEAKKKTQLNPGVWMYDLAQNFSGIPSITVTGKKGDTVILYTSELINEDGSANQKATGSPHYYTYILKGEGVEEWHPKFTFYGFRYVEVRGAVPEGHANPSNLPVVKGLQGLHIRNAAETIGEFSSSNDLFNRTNTLIDWAIKSNTMSVFMDCPHREKLGWLEQTHLMGSSVQYNYDIAALGRKVTTDMINAQNPNGLIPDIAPEYVVFGGGFTDSPEWGSAGIILPWYLYQWYGDKLNLERGYDMMKRYVAYLKSKSTNHIVSHGLGDWFDIGPDRPGVSQLTPLGVTATATYYYDLTIMQKIATLLGKANDAKEFLTLASEVKKAFNKTYFNDTTKNYATGSQASNAMALYMDLVEPKNKQAVLNNLIKDIRNRNNALSAGDVGYRYVLRALEAAGRSDVIFDMNSRDDVPGYGYQLKHGATALTESWQAYENVSNNHFMLGHLMEWFYSGLAGIRQKQGSVGYKQIEIRPQPVGNVNHAKGSYRSVHGLITSDWKRTANNFEINVTIPSNTTATIYFPNEYKKAPVKVGSGKYKYVVRK